MRRTTYLRLLSVMCLIAAAASLTGAGLAVAGNMRIGLSFIVAAIALILGAVVAEIVWARLRR